MTTYTGTPRVTPRRWLLRAAGGAAVLLTAGTGVGAWRLTQHNQAGSVASVSQAQLPLQQSGVQASTAAVTSNSQPLVQFAAAPSLVLVSSAEQAAALQQTTEQAEGIRSQAGLPLDPTIISVSGDADANTAVRDVADQNGLRAALGLPPIQVVDLRSAASSAPAAVHSPASSSRVIAGQLPGSLDQETLLRLRIEEGQLAITRAMAGEVLPNFSPAAQATMEQGQQAITRALTGQPPLMTVPAGDTTARDAAGQNALLGLPPLEITHLQDVAPAAPGDQAELDMTRITAGAP